MPNITLYLTNKEYLNFISKSENEKKKLKDKAVQVIIGDMNGS